MSSELLSLRLPANTIFRCAFKLQTYAYWLHCIRLSTSKCMINEGLCIYVSNIQNVLLRLINSRDRIRDAKFIGMFFFSFFSCVVIVVVGLIESPFDANACDCLPLMHLFMKQLN